MTAAPMPPLSGEWGGCTLLIRQHHRVLIRGSSPRPNIGVGKVRFS